MITAIKTDATQAKPESSFKSTLLDWFILILVLTFIAAFNAAAMQDRLLLILYSIGVAGAAFTLLKRHAFVLSVITLTGAGTALLVNVYFQTTADVCHPLLDPVRDIVGLGLLAFVMAKLIFVSFRIQKDARDAEMRHIFEEKLVAMRAGHRREIALYA